MQWFSTSVPRHLSVTCQRKGEGFLNLYWSTGQGLEMLIGQGSQSEDYSLTPDPGGLFRDHMIPCFYYGAESAHCWPRMG